MAKEAAKGFNMPNSSLGLSVDMANVFRQSIQYCSEKLKIGPSKAIEQIIQNDTGANSYFRYALAKQLCEYLGGLGNTCKTIYIHGSAVRGTACSASDIDLILLVNKKVDELITLLAKLNLLMVKYYQLLMGDKFKEMDGILDIQIIDHRDILDKKGYGSVVTSLHASPIKIWEEDEAVCRQM